MANCPQFWQTRKIEINLLNMKDEEYMDNIRMTAFIAIGMDIAVGIGSFIYIWRTTGLPTMLSNSRGFAKFKFLIMKIVLGFGMPLADTASGKRKLFENFIVQLESFIMTHYNIKAGITF